MGRGLLHIAGGALQGTGRGMVARVLEQREARLEELRHQRRQRERAEDRDFRREETDRDRAFRTEEAEKTRAASAAEAEKTRAVSRDLLSTTVTGEDRRVRGITRGGDTVDLGVTAAPKGVTPAQQANAAEIRQARKILGQWADAAEGEGLTLAEYVQRRSNKTNAVTGLPEPDYSSDATRIARLATQVIPGTDDREASAWSQRLYGVAAFPEDPEDEPVAGTAAGVGTRDNPARPTSRVEFDALPSGSYFVDPDGRVRRTP